MITIKNLTKAYSQGENELSIFKDFSIEIEGPSTVAIVGKSGSGKTTLLSLVSALDSHEAGEIFLNDVNISRMGETELAQYRAKNVGIIFQKFHLIESLNAFENVELALDAIGKKAPQRVYEVLDLVGLNDRAQHFPKELSGGEQQRIAIARAIINEPKFLFADEPSGNLDEETSSLVMSQLFNIAKNKSMMLFLITHDLDLAGQCEQVYELKNRELKKIQ